MLLASHPLIRHEAILPNNFTNSPHDSVVEVLVVGQNDISLKGVPTKDLQQFCVRRHASWRLKSAF